MYNSGLLSYLLLKMPQPSGPNDSLLQCGVAAHVLHVGGDVAALAAHAAMEVAGTEAIAIGTANETVTGATGLVNAIGIVTSATATATANGTRNPGRVAARTDAGVPRRTGAVMIGHGPLRLSTTRRRRMTERRHLPSIIEVASPCFFSAWTFILQNFVASS